MRAFILVALAHALHALQLPVTMPPLPKWSTQLNVENLPQPPTFQLPSLPDAKLPAIELPQAPTLPQAPDGSVTDLATRLLSEAQHALQGDWTPYATVMAASCAATVALTLPALLLTGAAERKRLERTATQLPEEAEALVTHICGGVSSESVDVPDDAYGEVSVAVTALKEEDVEGTAVDVEGTAVDASELARWARMNMAEYKAPRTFHLIDEIPRNAMGKVNKKELRRLYLDGSL